MEPVYYLKGVQGYRGFDRWRMTRRFKDGTMRSFRRIKGRIEEAFKELFKRLQWVSEEFSRSSGDVEGISRRFILVSRLRELQGGLRRFQKVSWHFTGYTEDVLRVIVSIPGRSRNFL